MQAQDLTCSECRTKCDSASALLHHFAVHATVRLIASTNKEKPMTSRKLPDLRPIHCRKKGDSDIESDSGVEDVNPIKFCLVTMADDADNVDRRRKYQCGYCFKRFGWPTDLKRHVLVHTGERPFQCQICDSTFTRNFLLKKHQRKCHNDSLPDLQPIVSVKSRKQEKSQIKRLPESMSASHPK